MSTKFMIQRAIVGNAQDLLMVGKLLAEIMKAFRGQAVNFDLGETTSSLKDFIEREKHFVFVARSKSGLPAGFIPLYESYAPYAGGLSVLYLNFTFVRSVVQTVLACALRT
jgi:hypothetical protein